MTDNYTRHSAEILLDVHGDDAFEVARERADQCYEDGNSAGEQEWTRVLSMLSELAAKRRVARSSIH